MSRASETCECKDHCCNSFHHPLTVENHAVSWEWQVIIGESVFATLVVPLTDLLKPSQNFVWTPECQLAFRLDKYILCKAPILAGPFFFSRVSSRCKRSCCVLLQKSETNVELPVGYFSEKLNGSQQRYGTIKKEALALFMPLSHFKI